MRVRWLVNSLLVSRAGELGLAVGVVESGSDPPGGGKERPMTIRTFLVDDHALVRTGIRMILSGAVDIDIIGEAESGEQALPQIRERKTDVGVWERHLPGGRGLEGRERTRKGGAWARGLLGGVFGEGAI